MFHVRQLKKTDSGEYGRDVELTKIFYVWSDNGIADNANDPGAAMSWLLNQGAGFGQAPLSCTFPSSSIPCIFSNISFDPVSDFKWQFTIKYTPPEAWRGTGDNAFSFNTAGGTQHIRHAFRHIASLIVDPLTGAVVNSTSPSDGALNPAEDGTVQGIDRDVAQFAFQMTIYRATISNSYVDLLEKLTDTVNAIDFTTPTADGLAKTFPAGSCRFKGATGAKRRFSDWELTLNFVSSPNTIITVGPFVNVPIDGWDYVNVVYWPVDDTTNNMTVPAPALLTIDQIYDYENWTGLIP